MIIYVHVNIEIIFIKLQPPIEETSDDGNRKSPLESDKKEAKGDVALNVPVQEVHSVGGVLVHMPHVCSVRN